MKEQRKAAAILFVIVAAFFLYSVFTLPAISATAPAILAIACGVAAWFVWPRDIATTARRPAAPAQLLTRLCPNCERAMGRTESVCPHCGTSSTPLVFHAGVWWTKSRADEWQWLEEKVPPIWRWYKDGTPSDPATADRTPNLAIDPALVKPPDAQAPDTAITPSERTQSDSFTDELERLADLHARGALSDEQFEAAKSRLLGT